MTEENKAEQAVREHETTISVAGAVADEVADDVTSAGHSAKMVGATALLVTTILHLSAQQNAIDDAATPGQKLHEIARFNFALLVGGFIGGGATVLTKSPFVGAVAGALVTNSALNASSPERAVLNGDTVPTTDTETDGTVVLTLTNDDESEETTIQIKPPTTAEPDRQEIVVQSGNAQIRVTYDTSTAVATIKKTYVQIGDIMYEVTDDGYYRIGNITQPNDDVTGHIDDETPPEVTDFLADGFAAANDLLGDHLPASTSIEDYLPDNVPVGEGVWTEPAGPYKILSTPDGVYLRESSNGTKTIGYDGMETVEFDDGSKYVDWADPETGDHVAMTMSPDGQYTIHYRDPINGELVNEAFDSLASLSTAAGDAFDVLTSEAGQRLKEAVESLAEKYPDSLLDLPEGLHEIFAPLFARLLPPNSGEPFSPLMIRPFEIPGVVEDGLVPWGQAPDEGSPLTIDLDGDGVELTTFTASTTATFFDIDGDGFAEQTAWVDGDDGLLVRDLDSSGTIDSSAELFGSATIDGFALLASFDLNGDHIINQHDAVWGNLLVWKDANEDAITQDGELHTLASVGIVGIDLAGIAPSSSTISGNPITHTSSYRLDNGTNRPIVDAWFIHDNTNTRYVGEYQLDIRTLFLPNLRGFGKLADLHIAMSQNEELLLLVQDFATNWGASHFDEGATVTADIEEILWAWAGVDGVSPSSRGPNIDARKLEFMERYFGNDFLQNGVEPNPQPFAADVLNEAWDTVITYLKAHLVFQAGAATLFEPGSLYDAFAGDLVGDLELSQAGVDELETSAPVTGIEQYWIEVGHFLHTVRGLNDLSVGEVDMLDEAVVATDAGLSWDYIKNEVLSTIEGDTIDGTSGNDTITGTQYADVLNGHDGDDTISGGDGHDELSGGDGADILDGGSGNDTLTGYLGNDTFRAGTGGNFVFGGGGDDLYEYEGGNDVYSEIGDYTGTDKIVLPSGVVANDLSFFQVASGVQPGSLFIDIDGLGRIETPYFSAYGGNLITDRIETIEFSDTSTFNFNTLTSFTTYGTDEDNYVYGIQFSSHLDDTLYGLGGNDYLYGQDGNDTLDGGLGNDILNGNAGDDVYIFSAGFDTINEEGGDDTIMLPAGYDAGDISFVRLGGSSYHLELRVDGLGQLLIQGQLYPGPSNGTVETISFNGSSSIDILDLQVETIGSSSTDYLYGIEGGASIDDIMDGREGDDYLYGFAGDDTYYFSLGNDVISELSGDDTIRFRSGWNPEDVSIYRQGTTLVLADQNGNSLSAQQHFTQVGSSDNSAYQIEQIVFADSTVWTLASIEIVTLGTASADTIDGTLAGDASNADTIFGLGGNDTLSGYDGDDVLDGGDGDDTFYGGAGNDRFVAGIGLDYVSDHGVGTDVLHVTGGVTINDITIADYGSYYDSKIVIDSGVDEIHIAQLRYWDTDYVIELVTFDDGFTTSLPDYGTWLTGTSGNDVSAGNSGDNTIIGLAGNDTITGAGGNDDAHGGAGEDSLDGGDGNDLLYGGDDDDILYGKAGLDTMHGGDGADTFVFETASAFSDIDVIRDFSVADDDVLDLTDILDTVYDPMTDAIADFVEFTESSGSTFVSVDRDGTGGTYSMAQIIKLENVTGLASPDTLEANGNLLAA